MCRAAWSGSSGPGTPPIILFLLSDAERILSGALRANELPTDGTGFVRPALGSNTSSFSSDMDSPTVANEELHECVYRVWNHFRRWGSDNNSNGGSTTALVPGRQGVWGFGSANSLQQSTSFYSQAANQAELADVQRDPLYQLILTTVLQYKSLQQLLLAALFDMTLSHFGVGEANPTGSLVVVCAGLAPNPQRMLVEMGYAEDERPTWGDVAAGGIVGMRGEDSHDTPTKTTAAMQSEAMTSVDSPIIPSPSATPAVATVATRSNEANWVVASVPIPVPPPRRRRASQLESAITPAAATTADYDSDIVSSQTTDRSKIEVDTASSSARKRASQRIQEQRRAGGLSPSGGLEESGNSSMDEDVARAKWSPLFSSSQPRDLPLARPSGVAESKPTRHRGRSSHAATIANPAASDRVNSPALSNPASSSLSDQEAMLLTEILSTSDTSKQNELIERMKRLRMGETATAATIPPLPKAAPTPRVAVCRTESQDSVAESSGGSEGPGVYGQFQKLEESVLTEYDRRLSEEARVSGPGKPKAESSTEAVSASNSYSRKADAHIQENHFIPQQNSTLDETPSNIAPSDAASMGPSSIEELLQQGKGTGQYAQMLREILRKMSKDDSQLQLRALEQVLELGHSIAQQDSQERLHEARVAHVHGQQERRRQRTPSPRRASSTSNAGTSGRSPPMHTPAPRGGFLSGGSGAQRSHNSSFTGSDVLAPSGHNPAIATPYTPTAQYNSHNSNISSNGAITRLARVPGQTPDPHAKKVKKVFGHAVK